MIQGAAQIPAEAECQEVAAKNTRFRIEYPQS
jgi:hypothetical protein